MAGRKFIVYGYTYNIARSCGFYVISREIGIRQIVNRYPDSNPYRYECVELRHGCLAMKSHVG